jgi:hypothetical protein
MKKVFLVNTVFLLHAFREATSPSSLLLWLWLLLAFARPLLPLLPLMSYTTCPLPLPLCVAIAPFFLAFISFLFTTHYPLLIS